MKKNMGIADRLFRIVVALGVLVLYMTNNIAGTTAIVLGVVAVVLVLTGLTGYCPGYVPLGISTRRGRSDSVRV
jgi:hypothetical protein